MDEPTVPPRGNWGRWGQGDERGALNLITPERVLAALDVPASGRVYSLSQLLQRAGSPMVSSRPAPLHLFQVDGGDYASGASASNGCCSAEDVLVLHVHGSSTHLDALGHIWTDDHLYNGFSRDTVRSTGMRRCGVEKVESIVTRGVLLDVPRALGVQRLEGGYAITPSDLEAALDLADLTLAPGDAVLLRTGWYTRYEEDPEAWEETVPGLGLDGATWLAERDVVLVGADNPAVEAMPFPEGTTAPVHQLLLRDHGIYLLELLYLEDLAGDGHAEFLFVGAPLRFRGATGSPMNPLAIV